MQIVIKIPKEKAERLIRQMKLDRNFKECEIVELPKGHGRLKDENEIKKMIEEAKVNSELSKSFAENIIRFTPTIIEADDNGE